jgi:hypothetical protein
MMPCTCRERETKKKKKRNKRDGRSWRSGDQEDDQGNHGVLDGEWAATGLLGVDRNVELVFTGLTLSIEEEGAMVVAMVFEEMPQRGAKIKNSSCRRKTRMRKKGLA